MKLTTPRAQIALEFLLVFSFVLLVFIFIFALITSQRSLGMSYQSFSQLQLVAQSVAMAMSNAATAGNGYTVQLPISSTIGMLPYNLTVTKSGIVVASMRVGEQLVQARAYSAAKSVVSSQSFAKSATSYQLPLQNGTISIQSYYGEVCVDYNCQRSYINTASSINLSSENVYAASFSQSPAGYIRAPATAQSTNAITVGFWLFPVNNGYWGNPGNYWENAVSGSAGCWNNYYFFIEAGANPPTESWSVTTTGGTQYRDFPGVHLRPNTWQYLVGRYNGTYLSVWLNGQQIGAPVSANVPISYDGVAVSGATPVTSGGGCNPISGEIANVQVYNSSLSAGEIEKLYSEGIGAPPLSNASLLDWLPLDGNAKDYGGVVSGSTVYGSIIFTSVAELMAKVTNAFGAYVSNALVGFATTFGTLTSASGFGNAVVNYTNSNGVAVAFLNYNSSGTATVKATAFSGNISSEQNLVAWWPLNLGSGNIAYDLSGRGNNGNMVQTAWSMPNYVASMSGGYIYAASSPSLSPSSTMSAFAWVKPSSQATAVLQKQGSYGMKIGVNGAAQGQFAGYVWGTSGVCSSYPFALNPNSWYLVGFTFNGVMLNEYVNGNLYCNISYSGSIPKSALPVAFGGPEDNDGNVNGDLANVQIYNTVLTPPQVAQLYQEGLSAPPFSSGLVAWWPLDGNSNDYSGNGNNGTLYGSASFVAPGVGNYDGYQSSILAAEFNGANSMIITPISFNTPSFAAVLWVNGASTSKMTSVNGYTIFNSIGANNFQMWLNNGGSLGAPVGSGDEEIGFGTNLYHGYGINGSSWNMLAVSVSNGKASLYANGAGPYNLTIPTGPYSLNALAIGQSAAGISPFAGGIANIQLYNQTLTPSQVSQLYGEGISGIPISGQKMIAWWPLEGNSNDYSGNGNNGAPSNIIYNAQQPNRFALVSSIEGYGVTFNGHGGSIQLPPLQALNGHSSFTVNTWLNWHGGSQYFGQNPFPVGWPGCHTGFMLSSPNLITFFEWYTSNPSNPPGCPTTGGGIAPGSAHLQPNTWYMLTGDYNNATKVLSLYVDGQYYSSAIVPAGNYLSNYDEVGYIGDALDGNTGTYFFNGSIANVQIFNTSLSAQQILQLYQSGMPAYAPRAIPMSWSP
ncbi:MAG: LamG-like jellyroll fold domain-containing protein [Candidatus Micrarchaeia archaeon]